MPLKVAMPIIKKPSGSSDYASFYAGGNPKISFPSPIQLEAPAAPVATPVQGLRIQVTDPAVPEIKRLYAMVPGILSFTRTATTFAVSLTFVPPVNPLLPRRGNLTLSCLRDYVSRRRNRLKNFNTLHWLYWLNNSCLQLDFILYAGVNAASVSTALCTLLDATNWPDYKDFLRDHPRIIMRNIDASASGIPEDISLFNIWNQIGRDEDEAKALLRRLFETIRTGSTTTVQNIRIPVDAGTWIGDIATDAFQLFFSGKGSTYLNPVYFFRLILKWYDFDINATTKFFSFVENYQLARFLPATSQSNDYHPLLWLMKNTGHTSDPNYLADLNADIGRYANPTAPPASRRNIEKYWRLILPPGNPLAKVSSNTPTANLVDYSRVVTGGGQGVPATAAREWRVDDYGYLLYREKTRTHPWHHETYFVFDFSTTDLIENIYDNLVNHWLSGVTFSFNDLLTFECIYAEAFLAIVARESSGGRYSCRIEPTNSPTALSRAYNAAFGTACEAVYNPARPSAVIRGSYTWVTLRSDLDNSAYPNTPMRVSPGLSQTLVGGIPIILHWMTRRSHPYIGSLGLPTANSARLTWLFEPENAVVMGVGEMRANRDSGRYNGLDPVKVRICYGGGSLRERGGGFGYRNCHFINHGQVLSHGSNRQAWAAFYNAAVSLFNKNAGNPSGTFTEPSVRIMNATL